MSHNNVTTWTCDRCQRQVSVDHHLRPDGWTYIRAEGGMIRAEIVEHEWELCPGCYSQVERLLMHQRAVAAA
jgi:hypothetical protein